ncbi:MAG: ChaN family lipoprotein [Lewinellaceae bacterium]|nr:ChaN family lipoprotein [Lewinellaceae bacterium]
MNRFVFYLILCCTFSAFTTMAQDKPPYELFDAEGKSVKYRKLLKEAQEADIIFFGELHNNPIAHWLELELAQGLHEAAAGKLVLGAEMFEADNQLQLTEFLDDKMNAKTFEEDARLWKNYKTDYKPLVEYAKAQGLPFIATNVPRRYASLVYKEGFEGLEKLSDEAHRYLPPLPVPYDAELPCYKSMMDMMSGHGGPPNENFPKAQAIKDATMAHFISQNWQKGQTFLHFNGSYHSENHEGILWYLKQNRPEAKMLTIMVVEQADISKLEDENKGKADFVIVVTEQMTKTY